MHSALHFQLFHIQISMYVYAGFSNAGKPAKITRLTPFPLPDDRFPFWSFLWCVTFDIKNELWNREQGKAARRLVTMWRHLLFFLYLLFQSLYRTQSSSAARTETDGEWFARQSPEFRRMSLRLPRSRTFATTKKLVTTPVLPSIPVFFKRRRKQELTFAMR